MNGPTRSVQGTDRPWLVTAFPLLLAAIFALKLALAWAVPLTGDEAYFDLWARSPALGYYDHPPMVGWWLIPLQGAPVVLLRLPAVLVTMLPGLLFLWLFGRTDPVRARLAALVAWSVPLFMFGVATTTDTPLILFGLCALALCQKGVDTGRARFFLLGGVALGMAFLSKYFAVLLGVGIAAHLLTRMRPLWPKGIKALALLALGVMPAVALNMLWNACNCWYNVQFNLVSRTAGAQAEPSGLLVYLLMLAWLLMPWVLWAFWRHRAAVLRASVEPSGTGLWITASLSGLAILGLVSVFRDVGLHWLAVFLPGVLLALMRLPASALARLAWASLGFAALHGIALAALLALPPDRLAALAGSPSRAASALFYRFPDQLATSVVQQAAQMPLFSESYSRAAILTYYTGHAIGVFGAGSRYGRHFDTVTDFASLDGTDLGIVLFQPDRSVIFAPFFDETSLRPVGPPEMGAWLFEGRGFRFEAYRDQVLSAVVQNHYLLPSWLPAARCPFLEMYGLTASPP